MGNIWKVILGVAAMAVSLVIYPIILDGVAAITSNANIADYTGLSAFANVLPLLILVGMIFGGGLFTFQGARGMRSGSKSKSGKKYS